MNLEIWQWAFLAAGALIIGLSKTGIGGLGMLAVLLFAGIAVSAVGSAISLRRFLQV